jgi:hypothetical protein
MSEAAPNGTGAARLQEDPDREGDRRLAETDGDRAGLDRTIRPIGATTFSFNLQLAMDSLLVWARAHGGNLFAVNQIK